jgi:hypothetical protein
MTCQTNERTRSFLNGLTAIDEGLRVVKTAGVLALAGLADKEIGTAVQRIEASVYGTVLFRNTSGTRLMIASGSITDQAVVYSGADGKVSASQGEGAHEIGQAMEAASDGDLFEVMMN